MAQIWLTYDEMAATFGGTRFQAREAAIQNGWARMKGRDGVAHVRLTPTLAREFLERQLRGVQHQEQDAATDLMVASLRSVLPAQGALPVPRVVAA